MQLGVLLEFMDVCRNYSGFGMGFVVVRAFCQWRRLPKAAAFTLAALRRDMDGPMLVVAPRPEDARRLHEQLVAWCGEDDGLLQFAESEILPFERLDSDMETVHQRLQVLSAVASAGSDIDAQDRQDGERGPMVVASVGALNAANTWARCYGGEQLYATAR